MKDIYMLFWCDEWKSRTSMTLCTATNHIGRFLEVLKDELIAGNMECTNTDFCFGEMSTPEVIREKLTHFNSILDYGYIDIVKDGEVQ